MNLLQNGSLDFGCGQRTHIRSPWLQRGSGISPLVQVGHVIAVEPSVFLLGEMVNHALAIGCKQQTRQQCWVFGAMLARALLPPFDESVGGIPDFWRNDRLVLPRITLALVHHLAKVDAVAQHGEQVLLIDRPTRAMQATLRDPGFRGLALDGKFADKLRRSCPVAFGSTRTPGFSAWTTGQRLSDAMRPVAAGILLFDAIIQNPDRRAENPNCLVQGDDLRIIDHELAFMHRVILLWQAPWLLGGMKEFETPGRHIFVHELKGVPLDFGPIKSRWAALSDARLREYEGVIPPEWAAARADMDAALKLIADARDTIDACIGELGRILS